MATAREQFLAKLDVVEILAVERNSERSVLVRHRLRAAADVDHAQTGVGQTCGRRDVHTAVVRTAVIEHRNHRRQAIRLDAVSLRRAETCDSTHASRLSK